jgi:Domain of unknown function (DUF4129)
LFIAWLGLGGFCGIGLAADDPALAVVEACRAKLDARNDVGLERIGRRCPELLRTLAGAPWSKLLPQDLLERRDEISAQSLRELVELIRAAEVERVARAAPDLAKLAPVLAELGEKGQQGATRWERFKQWLKDKFDRREEDQDEDSWLEKFGREFETSEGVARAITYIGYALMGLLVLYVIWSELRAAGLLGGTRESRRAQEAAQWRRRLQLADVMQAPLADRPGLMLKLLGDALTRSQRLPAADGLTAEALVRQARLDSDAERAELASVARTADAVRYGPRPPEEDKLQGAVSSARSLLDKFAQVKASLFRRRA